MGVEDIDNIETPLADSQSNSFSENDTGSAGLGLDTSDGWRLTGGDGGEPSWTAPSLTHTLGPGRREKLASLFSGSYDPKQARLESLSKGVTGYEMKKEEPLIGPDGGMVGRGIKAAGDWYLDYVDNNKGGLDNVMRDKLTPHDWAVDMLETGSRGLLTRWTGIETDFTPRYAGNRVLQFGLSPIKMLGGAQSYLKGAAGSLISPTQALVQGARAWGGEEIKPKEAASGAASLWKAGVGVTRGVGSSTTLQAQDLMDKYMNAGSATGKALENQR
ncbi:hypothetical protein NNJEOMEG_03477 [Fundidesulfovibrio magnetotacticus]|uniref:Uncharacterized protein n=1 Tax=Fundidesulfovibrio magnetotacticus TaxID=2730080 RepID=A0A6V8M016_9BACT|nr:hypothetical protein [Fundidesulfovibrio magnetotacticus]GFK95609.1 hypothetical protein NNJEOMEG_03477 [Fundidesulfovibrio magnetotacticus]